VNQKFFSLFHHKKKPLNVSFIPPHGLSIPDPAWLILHQKQQKTMSKPQFTIFGNKYRMGSYILMIHLSSPLRLAFGRFQQGELFTLPEGDYLYIGSALGGEKAGAPLARRLLRHASRSGSRNPHTIRTAMMTLFLENNFMGKSAIEPSEKKLRWHVDYFLELREAEIDHIVIIRSPVRLEQKLSELLESLPETSLVAPRLGAQDTRNSTHLLRCTDRERILELIRQWLPGLTSGER
jgi:Uri superfamily endonuclease